MRSKVCANVSWQNGSFDAVQNSVPPSAYRGQNIPGVPSMSAKISQSKH
jgi:hypothetical protein